MSLFSGGGAKETIPDNPLISFSLFFFFVFFVVNTFFYHF